MAARTDGARLIGSSIESGSRDQGGDVAKFGLATAIGALAATAVLVAGCSSSGGGSTQQAGADPAKVGAQPGVVSGAPSAAVTATAAATATSSGPPPELVSNSVSELGDRLRTDLHNVDPASSNVAIEQRAFAHGQLIITWMLNSEASDKTAKARLRTDAIELLRVTSYSKINYASVLLICNARVYYKKTTSTTVVQGMRAKYSRALVLRTDYSTISPSQIFVIPDDKPATIYSTLK